MGKKAQVIQGQVAATGVKNDFIKKLAVWSMIIWLWNACMNMGVSKLRTVLRLACIESFLQDILGEILGDAPEWAFHIDHMEPRFW